MVAAATRNTTTILKDMEKKQLNKNFLNGIFYGSIGLTASLALFLVFYWSLRLNASIANLITNFAKDLPFYFWPYVLLTLGTIVLFGLNASVFVYRWRRFGPPKIVKSQSSSAFGAVIGTLASACPICGSTLLSLIGISGGLTAFPFGGLELKVVSFLLMAFPLALMKRDLAKFEKMCTEGTCPPPQDPAFKAKDKSWLSIILALLFVLVFVSWNMLKSDPAILKLLPKQSTNLIINPGDNQTFEANTPSSSNPLFDEVTAKVLPEKGFQSKIVLGESILKLTDYGVIDREKLASIYEGRGEMPELIKNLLEQRADEPILLTKENANYYINFLWALGLSNYMRVNEESPVNGKSLFNFASTGGWSLGKEENGGAYFSKFRVVQLTIEQEQLVKRIAENTYRPCCNNSTFFQDCNHGSALLGLLELGAAQGLTEDELYREALAWNSFWFPHNYIQTALYFKAVKNVDWENVDPKVAMGKDFSTISGWDTNVQKELAARNLIPEVKGGAGCGV